MANHFSEFSEVIQNINDEEKMWLEKDLRPTEDIDVYKDSKKQKAFEKAFAEERGIEEDWFDAWPGFAWSFIEDTESVYTLHMTCEESFNTDCLIASVQRFLQRFRPAYTFRMTWAETCDNLRIGAFGGGWCVITASDCKIGNTWEACDNAAEIMMEEIKCQKKNQ